MLIFLVFSLKYEVNKKEALKWYKKAAEQGYGEAQYNLGLMYDNGEGVEINKQEAIKWYKKSAKKGIAQAQYDLAVTYYNGDGIKQDIGEAIYWFQKAAKQGYESSIQALKALGF